MAEYIVVRGTHQRMDGTWFDRSRMPVPVSKNYPAINRLVLGPMGVFESREDGIQAEVYHPIE